MGELQRLRDAAKSAGQLSAAITAKVKRGELMRFYVKQVESAREAFAPRRKSVTHDVHAQLPNVPPRAERSAI